MEKTKLGQFLLLEEIGKGGMGTVYRAQALESLGSLRSGEQVAIKIVHPELLDRRGAFQQFLREGEIGSRIQHPNVVRTHAVETGLFRGERVCFLVMEFVSGRNMRALLSEMQVIPESLVREIALQVAEGLSAIHAHQVVHRDLKPENILITDDQQVRILDLGVARAVDETIELTRAGEFKGTLYYASPEQLGEGDIGFASDQYSLGIVLYELLTGVKPFPYDTVQRLMVAHICESPLRLSDQRSAVSSFLTEVVHTLLQKAPASRFHSVMELRTVLREGENSGWWAEREWNQRREVRSIPEIPVRRDLGLQGRGKELEKLRSLWTKCAGGDGVALLIEGEAGIGKSRLIDAFLRAVGEADVHLLYGSYSPAGGARALSDAIVNLFGAAGLGAALDTYLSTLSPLSPALTAMLRHESPPADAVPVTRDAIQLAFCALLQGLAREKPVLWVVEDLHFATEDSRLLIMALARAIAGHQGMLLVSSRPGGIPSREMGLLRRIDNFERMRLARLEEKEVLALLRDAFSNTMLAERLGARVARRSDGVPFFVCEMVRSLKDERLVQAPSGKWEARGSVEDIEVPPAVRELIDGRLEDLTPDRRDALDVGSVMGFEFDPRVVATVLSRPAVSVLRDLAHLERETDLVVSQGACCRFDHHQIQEHVYGALPAWLRQEYHHLVAMSRLGDPGNQGDDSRRLSGEDSWFLAHHLLHGSHAELGIPYLKPALQHLFRAYRDDEGRALMRVALRADILPPKEQIELMLEISGSLLLAGRYEENEELLRSALALAEREADPILLAKAQCARGRQEIITCRFTDARATLMSAAQLAARTKDLSLQGHLEGCLGATELYLNCFPEALARYERQLELAELVGDPVEQSHAHGGLAVALIVLGEHERVRPHLVSRMRIAAEVRDPRAFEGGTMTVAAALFSIDTSATLLAHLEMHVAASKAAGDRRSEAISLTLLGALEKNLGRYTEAVAGLERARRFFRDLGARRLEGSAAHVLGEVVEQMGNLSRAREIYSEAISLREDLPDLSGLGASCVALGRLELGAEREDEADRNFRRALEIAEQTGEPQTRVLAQCYLSLLGGEPVTRAVEMLERLGPRLCRTARLEANFACFLATGKAEHLARAADILDEFVAIAPAESRERMVVEVPRFSAIRNAKLPPA